MIAKIVYLLQQRKRNAPSEWLKKLPQMAKRLEESLYRSAKSFDEYNDASTLKFRLQQLAMTIGKKANQQQGLQSQTNPQLQMPQSQMQGQAITQAQPQSHLQSQPAQPQMHQQQQIQQAPIQQPPHLQHQTQLQQQQGQQPSQVPNQMQQSPHLQQPQLQQQPHMQNHQPGQRPTGIVHQTLPLPYGQQQNTNVAQNQPQQQSHPQSQQQSAQVPLAQIQQPVASAQPMQQRMVNMSDINPMIVGGTQMSSQIGQTQQQPGAQHHPPVQQIQFQQQPQQQGAPALQIAGLPSGSSTAASVPGASRQVSDRQQVLRHQQQRLLLLRHAAKCQHEDNRCPVTPHCAGMKQLWKHIAECKNQKCLVPHCVSSRYVLSHYHRCKDVRCPVCGPVREAIHRSHEKQKHMQALKQRHQQAVQQTEQTSIPGQSQNVLPGQPQTTLSGQPQATLPGQPPLTLSGQPQVNLSGQPQVNLPVQPLATLPGQTQSAFSAPPQTILQGQPPGGATLPPQLGGSTPQAPTVPNVNASLPAGAVPSQPPMVPSGEHPSKRPKIGIQPAPGFQIQPRAVPQQVGSLPAIAASQAIPSPSVQLLGQPVSAMSPAFSLNQPQQPLQPSNQPHPVVSQPTVLQTSMSHPIVPQSSASLLNPQHVPSHGATAPSSQAPLVAAAQPGQPHVLPLPGVAFSNGQIIMPKYSGPKPQEDHTLINCFSVEQIEKHIEVLNNGLILPPQKLKAKAMEVLKVLQSHQHAWVFNTPVDPVELGLPDYFEVIKKPMDLGTVRKKLENGVYQKIDEFEGHVLLTFNNAMLYNPEGSVVYNMAKEMRTKFESDFARLMEQLNAEEDIKRRNGEACLLCGCEKLLFEPPVFYCNGMNCPSKRIRRNSYYYIGGNNQYHWCHQCFQEIRDNALLDLGDISIKKEELVKKKNDEVHEESWVQCDRCERWVHQICALFNTRQNKDQRSEYACPRCTIDERVRRGNLEPTSSTPMAEDLPRTKLSEYLENHVRLKVDEFLSEKAAAISITEGIDIADAHKKVEMGGAITIRQVTSMDRRLEVRDRMKKRYAFKNYPEEFSFRCKCIVVFQNLDGVDVILFGLYVYEHDEKNPAPNTRSVYVSYLDSVYFMRPRQMRTFIYHEILIAYLDHVRRRGFSTAHIWACPPLKGDDYILYAKPEDQKVPKDERLRQWYIDMLIEAQKRGVIGKLTNMYDLYFSDPKHDATCVPYMDGDYFPAEVENIIKDIEDGKTGKKTSAQGKKKDNKAKQKKKSGRGGTRSAGLDEEALKASGIIPPGSDSKSLEEGARDYVMVKLGETIQPMKESFIVAYLAWKDAKPEDMIVPDKIQEIRDKHGITWKLDPSDCEFEKSQTQIDGTATLVNGKIAGTQVGTIQGDGKAPGVLNGNIGDKPIGPIQDQNEAQSGTKDIAEPNSDQNSKQPINLSIREGKFAAMAARKRDRDGTVKDPENGTAGSPEVESESKTIMVKDSKGRTVKVLDDDAEELDCEFLNNRQAFLNLCQGNHYQFDQIRRAKHSSMMVLWHLHNRDAPKFVQQCATCSREILTGFRYHCPTCADFDQCQECISNVKIPRHPHQLKPIAIASGPQNELNDAQRKERQRSIQLHMTLLLHAATCNSQNCPSANCTKMKGLLKHGAQCQVKATGGCNVCKRIWALLQIHARQCKATSCPVPNCMAIRERVRQLKKQQQAMDDRRRQEMNRAYRGKR